MNLLVATTEYTDFYQIIYCRYSNPEPTGWKSVWCEMLNFGLLSVENTWKQTQFQSTQNSLNQYRLVPLPLHGVYLHIMPVRDMTIFNIWTWRTLPKPFIVETIQSRIEAYLNTDLHRLTTILTAFINIHVLSSWSFQIPLVHSPDHYRNILSLNNQRQWGRKSTFL